MRILQYSAERAQFLCYDSDFPIVANEIIKEIYSKQLPALVEHVGSTSVPNCKGKGIIDIAVFYNKKIEIIKKTIDSMGFQKQFGSHAFPETRPMRTGKIKYKNKKYRIHVHIVKFGCKEHFELITFRETLRNNIITRKQYESEKSRIIKSGISNSLEYAALKGKFIKEMLRKKAA